MSNTFELFYGSAMGFCKSTLLHDSNNKIAKYRCSGFLIHFGFSLAQALLN